MRSINPFKRLLFFKPKKQFFRKLRVQKWPKYVILSCGTKKHFGGEKGTEHVTPISYSVKVWGDTLTWWNFEFWCHRGVFRPFFRGRKAKNAWKISVTSAWTPPNCALKKLYTLEYIVKKKLTLCDKKFAEISLNTFVGVFCPLMVDNM